jgi:hypothetical protein
MKTEVYKEKVNTRDKLDTHIMNSAALLKQEHHDLRWATHNYCQESWKCIEVDGGIF